MRPASAVLGLLLATAAVSCSAPVRVYTCNVEPRRSDVDVHAVWACNRDVLWRAARGKPYSLREFDSAARFFERLTGRSVDTAWSHLGRMPGPELRRDLTDLDAWYELHKQELRWDAALGRAVFEGLAPPPGAV